MSDRIVEVVQGRIEDILPEYPENFFDAVLCDPPYGISFMGKKWDYDVPSVECWQAINRVLKPGANLLAFGGTRTYHRMVVNIEDGGFEIRDQIAWIYGSGFPKSQNIVKAGASEEWNGYGTALKPAQEPICVARKPLEGTMAANVVAHGVGGLNIDGTRIETDELIPNHLGTNGAAGLTLGARKEYVPGSATTFQTKGRWPANVILDEEAGAVMDAQSGNRPGMSGGGGKHKADYAGGMFGGIDSTATARNDSGGASRFFYCAKANRKERELGCDDLPARAGFEAVEREEGSAGLDNPRAGAGRTAGKVRNFHPTVKPIALTKYLATLIRPPGGKGRILVPFAGSGSEMIGALLADWYDIVGIEMNPDYVKIAQSRVDYHLHLAESCEILST